MIMLAPSERPSLSTKCDEDIDCQKHRVQESVYLIYTDSEFLQFNRDSKGYAGRIHREECDRNFSVSFYKLDWLDCSSLC